MNQTADADLRSLTVALGHYPHTAAFRARTHLGAVRLDFADVAPVHRAFAPMVREFRFDICEMAIVTFLQARAYDKPLVLLPVAVAARFQEPALLCRAEDRRIAGPADLAGKRVGVRAYSQTTGVWLRGILADDFGVAAESVRWITFEGAHIAEDRDPPWVERAAAGQAMLEMLRVGDLDAVIIGNERVDDPAFRTVFADPTAAAERFRSRHGFMPVNHLVTVRGAIAAQRPELVVELFAALRTSMTGTAGSLPVGRAAVQPSIALALRYASAQALLPRPLTVEETWAGLPAQLAAS